MPSENVIPIKSAMPLENIDVAIVGGGPAGLMAAETARRAGYSVCVFERMGSAGRKFLIAGKGGLNLTHSEPKPAFLSRYSHANAQVAHWLADFDSTALRAWAADLGIATIVGSSGRVFPHDLKAAPLMRGWLRRLRAQGVAFVYGQQLMQLERLAAEFRLTLVDALAVRHRYCAKSVVLAMGGGSWAKLGSDGSWVPMLRTLGVPVQDLQPSNCGFTAQWSTALQRHAGAPIKSISAYVLGASAAITPVRGEAMLSCYGLEGSLVYALSSALRTQLFEDGSARLVLDLAPDQSEAQLKIGLHNARTTMSLSEKLKRVAKLSPVKLALFYEGIAPEIRADVEQVARRVKALTLTLDGMRPIDEAISTAGGVDCAQLRDDLMLPSIPGLFCAGEMLNWDAPTGGYLLNACFASGKCAGGGAVAWLARLGD
jgi:uncharacterized flavoprotein (TIGR03862 family)